MKRAFISYSLADKDRFVVSRLISVLQEKGMTVTSSQNFYLDHLDFTTQKNIDIADLFIGVITDQSRTRNRVLNEWQYATNKGTPNLIVIEDTVHLENANRENVIRFNRHDLASAISRVNQKIESSRRTTSDDEWVKWVLGGAAIIALLSLLDNSRR
jgi:hypothetical protein